MDNLLVLGLVVVFGLLLTGGSIQYGDFTFTTNGLLHHIMK